MRIHQCCGGCCEAGHIQPALLSRIRIRKPLPWRLDVGLGNGKVLTALARIATHVGRRGAAVATARQGLPR
jgi:hypothetical protein